MAAGARLTQRQVDLPGLLRAALNDTRATIGQLGAQALHLVDVLDRQLADQVHPQRVAPSAPGDPEPVDDDGDDQQTATKEDDVFDIQFRLLGRITRPDSS